MSAADATELGPLLHRFDVAARDQQGVAVVRGASALLAGACSVALLLAKVPLPVFLAAMLGLVMSLVWFRQARKALRLSHDTSAHHLSLHREGFVVAQGAQRRSVRFDTVRAIAVDEERLDIVVKLEGDEVLRLEPRYAGVAIHDLVRSLQEACQAGTHHVGGVHPAAVTPRDPR
jgi:hypothetical protein